MSVRTLEMPVATLRYALCAFCETPVVDVFSASTPNCACSCVSPWFASLSRVAVGLRAWAR